MKRIDESEDELETVQTRADELKESDVVIYEDKVRKVIKVVPGEHMTAVEFKDGMKSSISNEVMMELISRNFKDKKKGK